MIEKLAFAQDATINYLRIHAGRFLKPQMPEIRTVQKRKWVPALVAGLLGLATIACGGSSEVKNTLPTPTPTRMPYCTKAYSGATVLNITGNDPFEQVQVWTKQGKLRYADAAGSAPPLGLNLGSRANDSNGNPEGEYLWPEDMQIQDEVCQAD